MVDEEDDFPFDEALAATYVGKTILVALTYLTHDGQLIRRQQIHGRIESATRQGILIVLDGSDAGEKWNMPPSLDAIRRAGPGVYRLEETGEEIENPDLLSSWTISKAPPTN
ncbi:MAG: hypothetical protein HY815_10195 [Candidatus Riflebacteria bacterium]|nr:hypothetical protein [Candidatus Riflebacteria bacterium]